MKPNFRAELICHPASSCTAVTRLAAECHTEASGGLQFRYILVGDLTGLLIPEAKTPIRADGLWEQTCFEAFVAATRSDGYHEFNFSPSGQWAAYAFDSYRERLAWLPSGIPEIHVVREDQWLELTASVAAGDLPVDVLTEAFQVNLTAVIEGAGGRKSYWALRHATLRPDFHHRSGFGNAIFS